MGQRRPGADVGFRLGDAHRPSRGPGPRSHRHHRAIAISQPSARAAIAAGAGGRRAECRGPAERAGADARNIRRSPIRRRRARNMAPAATASNTRRRRGAVFAAAYTPRRPAIFPPPPQYTPPALRADAAAGCGRPDRPHGVAAPSGDAFDPSRNPNAPGAPRQLGAPGVAAAEPPPAISDTPRRSASPARRLISRRRPTRAGRTTGRSVAAAAADQSEFDRRHAGGAAARQHAEGRIRSRLWLRAAQGLWPAPSRRCAISCKNIRATG